MHVKIIPTKNLLAAAAATQTARAIGDAIPQHGGTRAVAAMGVTRLLKKAGGVGSTP